MMVTDPFLLIGDPDPDSYYFPDPDLDPPFITQSFADPDPDTLLITRSRIATLPLIVCSI